MCWTCGQCCVFRKWVVGYHIVIGMDILDMWSVLYFDIWVLGSNIAIVLYILDLWSVLCVPYVSVEV